MRHQVALAIILPPPLRLCARPANRGLACARTRFVWENFGAWSGIAVLPWGTRHRLKRRKQRRPLEAVSPLRSLQSLWSRFAGGLFRKTRKNVLAGLCECSRSGGRNEIVSTRRVVPGRTKIRPTKLLAGPICGRDPAGGR